MSRTWNVDLVNMLAGTEVTRCFLVVLYNGLQRVRLTTYDQDIEVDGSTYLKTPGFTLSRYTLKNGGEPATLDIEIPFSDDGPLYTEDVRRGGWRGATFTVWIADFENPTNREVVMDGFVGLTAYSDRLRGTIELVTLADKLKDIVLFTIQPKCSFRLYSTQCGASIILYRKMGTVTNVISRKKFYSAITPPVGHTYVHGWLRWGGANNDHQSWIRAWDSGTGLFELVSDLPFDIQVGDFFAAHPGCAKTRTACASFDNIDRYPGFDFVAR